MKLSILLSACGGVLALALAFGTDARCLSAEEAASIVGGVNDKVCNASGTCALFNGLQSFQCPTSGSCQDCDGDGCGEFLWETCVQQDDSDCEVSGTNDCGQRISGSCDANDCCIQTMTLPPLCNDAPDCGATS